MTESVDSSAPWFITNDFATQGLQSIRSGDITDSQFSGFTVTGLFEEGVLAFDYKIDSESCCAKVASCVHETPAITLLSTISHQQ